MNDALARLVELMKQLRDPDKGCPWDKKQTFQSIIPYTLEETHEVIEAIENEDLQSLKLELGDLLFQVIFYSQLADEQQLFNFNDVVEGLIKKMHERHPHVFADMDVTDDKQIKENWQKIKKQQLKDHSIKQSMSELDGVPITLPALSRSQKLQNRAADCGFDWQDINKVRDKLYEEIDELDDALTSDDNKAITHELGDILIASVNLARHLNIDAEQSLRLANRRFEKRFNYIERQLKASRKDIKKTSLHELEQLWQEAKNHEKLG